MGDWWRKWVVLVAITWIQAFSGTNLDFSSYSSDLKSAIGISQVQLNYIGVASDMGKAFGWCCGICLLHFPPAAVMLVAAFMGLVGYGLQWLAIHHVLPLPYFLVLLLSLLAGCSICWFSSVCYVLCIKYFAEDKSLALSLSTCFTGLSAAIYNLIANSIDPNDNKLYLLLNAVVPLVASAVALLPITHNSTLEAIPSDNAQYDFVRFLFLIVVDVITGLYLLLYSVSSNEFTVRYAILGAAFLLVLAPLATPAIVYIWEWGKRTVRYNFQLKGSRYTLIKNDDSDVGEELIETLASGSNYFLDNDLREGDFHRCGPFKDNQNVLVGKEYSIMMLISQSEFWLYYVAYFCGGTIGLAYANNLGQISESLGYKTDNSSFVAIYSACSFFGRLLSTSPDLLRKKVDYARTTWLAVAIVPTPLAFLLLMSSNSKEALTIATVMIGLSSGFVFSAAISITLELFGAKRVAVNHNILITNIPLGSLLYSLLAALVYEANIEKSIEVVPGDRSSVCMGRGCYHETFVWWWWISLVGLVCSCLLSLRTKATYLQLGNKNIDLQLCH